jgi:uncharacterized membrane protein YdjX (TVP38/TMEM64 family)|tara:strand:+ start:190 stop:798 length:609 start_codon:yes stop_codon:yes gene_type:complete
MNIESNITDIFNNNLRNIESLVTEEPFLSKLYYFVAYIVFTSFSLPVAGLMGLLGGVIFDTIDAIILVSFASSIGALFSFWLSRYLLRDYLSNKYNYYYLLINEGFTKNGGSYLFAIRMCMIFPYFIINSLAGLTTIKSWLYYIISQIGMLPGTIIIVILGSKLEEAFTTGINIDLTTILILSILGILPIVSRYYFKSYIKK